MAMPTKTDIYNARSKLAGKRNAVTTDENKIEQYKSDIKDLEEQIQGLRDGLPQKQLDAEDAEAAAEKILREVEEAIGLDIESTDSSVLQGGEATFKAVYDKSRLPTGDLAADLLLQLLWDTGGCSITQGNVNSEEITVDTSSVQPGDYGISVSLTFI
jgi:hypothetical protein